mmetsp:Transcript_20268/g.39605  ORF Transcript_20268/g.39605 Transcript_20268/m.39605 type:complete len:208 (+) Transcript_20268:303-926(+)
MYKRNEVLCTRFTLQPLETVYKCCAIKLFRGFIVHLTEECLAVTDIKTHLTQQQSDLILRHEAAKFLLCEHTVPVLVRSVEQRRQAPLHLSIGLLAFPHHGLRFRSGLIKRFFKKQRRDDSSHCKNHGRDVDHHKRRIEPTNLKNDVVEVVGPTSTECGLKYRPQAFGSVAIAAIEPLTMDKVQRLIHDVSLQCLGKVNCKHEHEDK